jgi:hypothetical protein
MPNRKDPLTFVVISNPLQKGKRKKHFTYFTLQTYNIIKHYQNNQQPAITPSYLIELSEVSSTVQAKGGIHLSATIASWHH